MRCVHFRARSFYVPFFLGTLVCSSNQSDVTDLFWVAYATAGQQQQQELARGGREGGWRVGWHLPRGLGRMISEEEAEISALLFHGLWQREERKDRVTVVGMVLEGVCVCVCVFGGGGGHLVWCQSRQCSGMQHSRSSTQQCFLSAPSPKPTTLRNPAPPFFPIISHD